MALYGTVPPFQDPEIPIDFGTLKNTLFSHPDHLQVAPDDALSWAEDAEWPILASNPWYNYGIAQLDIGIYIYTYDYIYIITVL